MKALLVGYSERSRRPLGSGDLVPVCDVSVNERTLLRVLHQRAEAIDRDSVDVVSVVLDIHSIIRSSSASHRAEGWTQISL